MPTYFRTIWQGLFLIIQAAPGVFGRFVILNLIAGAGPALLLWLGKVVMEHGKIIEQGTHDDLMQGKGAYFEMFTRQASSYV